LPAFAQGVKAFDAAHASGVQERPLTPPGAPSFDVASLRLPAFARRAKAFDAVHAGGVQARPLTPPGAPSFDIASS